MFNTFSSPLLERPNFLKDLMSVIPERVYSYRGLSKHPKQELKAVLLGSEGEGKPGEEAAVVTGAVDESIAC